jgi:ABC-type cobalamin/Fe3+-siderophores transport system ATPase subunit
MSVPTLRLSDLHIGYDGTAVARVPDLELDASRVWIVTGPNGSGKTTLLKTMAGLLAPIAGAIVPAPRPGPQGAVFVHSTPVLFRGTVASNVQLCGDAVRAERALALFELAEWRDQPVARVSHGIRQRAALARAVARDAVVLLLDEPEGGLDDRARTIWLEFVRGTVRDQRMLIVLAAHRPAGFDGIPTAMVETIPGVVLRKT